MRSGHRTRLMTEAERARQHRLPHARPTPEAARKRQLGTPKAKDTETQLAVDALLSVFQSTRDQLAILRQTRAQRTVGTLSVPTHLRAPIPLKIGGSPNDPNSETGVETRTTIRPGRSED